MALLPHGELAPLISTYGYGTVAAMIALESVGVPLPGEATLIAAALIAATGHALSIWLVIAAAAGGAIIGGTVGFAIGRRFGYRLIVRYGRYVRLTEPRIKLGQYLFQRHGGLIVFFGRFASVLRAFAALLAGVNRMDWPRFLIANAAGGLVWAAVYGAAAYFLGQEISHLAEPVGVAAGAAAAIAVAAGIFYLRRHEAQLQQAAERALPGPLREP